MGDVFGGGRVCGETRWMEVLKLELMWGRVQLPGGILVVIEVNNNDANLRGLQAKESRDFPEVLQGIIL